MTYLSNRRKSESMVQISLDENRCTNSRAVDYVVKVGEAVLNLADSVSSQLNKKEKEKTKSDTELSLPEMTEYLIKDTNLWNDFQQVLADSNMVTNVGVIEVLSKFIAERKEDIEIGKRNAAMAEAKKKGQSKSLWAAFDSPSNMPGMAILRKRRTTIHDPSELKKSLNQFQLSAAKQTCGKHRRMSANEIDCNMYFGKNQCSLDDYEMQPKIFEKSYLVELDLNSAPSTPALRVGDDTRNVDDEMKMTSSNFPVTGKISNGGEKSDGEKIDLKKDFGKNDVKTPKDRKKEEVTKISSEEKVELKNEILLSSEVSTHEGNKCNYRKPDLIENFGRNNIEASDNLRMEKATEINLSSMKKLSDLQQELGMLSIDEPTRREAAALQEIFRPATSLQNRSKNESDTHRFPVITKTKSQDDFCVIQKAKAKDELFWV